VLYSSRMLGGKTFQYIFMLSIHSIFALFCDFDSLEFMIKEVPWFKLYPRKCPCLSLHEVWKKTSFYVFLSFKNAFENICLHWLQKLFCSHDLHSALGKKYISFLHTNIYQVTGSAPRFQNVTCFSSCLVNGSGHVPAALILPWLSGLKSNSWNFRCQNPVRICPFIKCKYYV
jgi:hypothetical protein